MKKSITKILMFLGFIVATAGLLIEGFDSEEATLLVLSTVFTAPFLAAALSVCFIFAKNDVVKNVGYALAALIGVCGILLMMSEQMIVAAIGLILMLASSLGYVIVLALEFFGFVKASKGVTAKSDISVLLGKYKEMEKENVITDEEFAQLKSKALETLAEKESVNLDDLKKWKKLLDQQVISEEEFANLKAKVFTK